jgi:anion-transporting  ArsA/GET3 family ATPase
MLDTKTTFDGLVERYSTTPAQAHRILDNRFYRNISGALSGTQEYMAAEKLYELHADERFDVVVVDTPPTRSALDFLDAPDRLMRFLDHRLYRILMTPTRAYLKAVNLAAQTFLRTVSRVVGSDAISDAIAFFQAFDGMEAGFRDRAEHVQKLLHSTETAYVVVASPRRDAVEEARYFTTTLRASHLPVAALVLNRMHPSFPAVNAVSEDGSLAPFLANLAELRAVAEAEQAAVEPLVAEVSDAPVARVPVLATDVHDLDGLAEIAARLFASS